MADHVEILSFVTLHKHGRAQQGAFEQLIQETPQAIACYQISGNFDYIVHFVCRSVGEYVEIHHGLIEQDPNIASVTTNVIMSETKKFAGYPLKELGRTGAKAERPGGWLRTAPAQKNLRLRRPLSCAEFCMRGP